MGWIKSSYEEKYLIFKEKKFKVFKKNLIKKSFSPKDQNNSRFPLYLFYHELEKEKVCHVRNVFFNIH
jgi:hypothetical protein